MTFETALDVWKFNFVLTSLENDLAEKADQSHSINATFYYAFNILPAAIEINKLLL